MTSDNSTAREPLDERLAQARDTAIAAQGDKIIAQEMGDQGQAIVLTDSRVLILKAGLTATGNLNGEKTCAFPLSEITDINMRKGPMGAVIQIVGPKVEPPAQGGPPDNVIVFTGTQRVKKCEFIAACIEEALGKPAEKVEFTPAEPESKAAPARVEEAHGTPKGGRAPVSLAEEMFAEMNAARTAPAPAPAPAVEAIPTPEPQAVVESPVEPQAAVVEDVEEEPEEQIESLPDFRPNPKLPKPVTKTKVGMGRIATAFGVLALLMLVGLAITSPLRNQSKGREVGSVGAVKQSPIEIKLQYRSVFEYHANVLKVLQEGRSSLSALTVALRSGNKQSIAAALQQDITDQVWRKVDSIEPPAGLVGAKEMIVSGLFSCRTVIANVSGNLQSSDSLDTRDALATLEKAQAQISGGLKTINNMEQDLEQRFKSADKKK